MTGLLLLQIAVILVAARLCGLLLARLGQPPVIGEMAAGILLGPIVFGAALPDLHAALFPAASLPALSALSTLGLVLFMFVIGAELRAPEGARAQVLAAVRVAGLATVYGSVFRVWLEDDDPGLARTMAALDRRLRRGESAVRSLDRACSVLNRLATEGPEFVRSVLRGRPASEPKPDPEPTAV